MILMYFNTSMYVSKISHLPNRAHFSVVIYRRIRGNSSPSSSRWYIIYYTNGYEKKLSWILRSAASTCFTPLARTRAALYTRYNIIRLKCTIIGTYNFMVTTIHHNNIYYIPSRTTILCRIIYL